jgi:hypothetical protein
VPLSAAERRIVQVPFFEAIAQVARVLPEVAAEAEWSVGAPDGLWLKFRGEGPTRDQSLHVDVVYFEDEARAGVNDSRRDAWERGVVSFVSDGREEDTELAERVPSFWRACVLEELAVGLVGRFPKGAAELRRVAEFLRRVEFIH